MQLIAAVEEGEISVSDAASIVDLPKPRHREALELYPYFMADYEAMRHYVDLAADGSGGLTT